MLSRESKMEYSYIFLKDKKFKSQEERFQLDIK